MTMKESLISVRVDKRLLTEFYKKCKRTDFGSPAEVLRKVIEAFVDDRLTIKPDPTKENLYHE